MSAEDPGRRAGFRAAIRRAPNDPELWLAYGTACEAAVWGNAAMEWFPSHPWTGRHPAARRWFEGEFPAMTGSLSERDIAVLTKHGVVEEVKTYLELGPAQEAPDGSIVQSLDIRQEIKHRVVAPASMGRGVLQIMMPRAIFEAQLHHGLLGDRVRASRALSRLTSTEHDRIEAAAKAYLRAAPLCTEPPQRQYLLHGVDRVASGSKLRVVLQAEDGWDRDDDPLDNWGWVVETPAKKRLRMVLERMEEVIPERAGMLSLPVQPA